jgi:hypothetical protein
MKSGARRKARMTPCCPYLLLLSSISNSQEFDSSNITK